jgi:LPXTG-site transpeptidase (sortase) family protein
VKTMKLRRRLGALIIVIGIGVAILPLLQQAYGAYSQWQLEREWEQAVRQAQQSELTQTSAWRPAEVVAQFFSVRSAQAAPAHPVAKKASKKPVAKKTLVKKPLTKRASRNQSTTVASRRLQQPRHRPLGLVRLEIPKLNMHAIVVDGTSNHQLARGPAHFMGTALPGETGNCAIAAHRNVYGSWFRDLNRLRPGDPIVLRTPKQTFTYRVTKSRIVMSNDFSVLKPTHGSTVTLVTCMIPHAKHRLVVFGQRV